MAIPHIYFKDYGKAKIFCPSYTKQLQYARLLSAIDGKVSTEQNSLASLSLQKAIPASSDVHINIWPGARYCFCFSNRSLCFIAVSIRNDKIEKVCAIVLTICVVGKINS